MCMRDQKRQQGLSVVRHGPGVHGGGDRMGNRAVTLTGTAGRSAEARKAAAR